MDRAFVTVAAYSSDVAICSSLTMQVHAMRVSSESVFASWRLVSPLAVPLHAQQRDVRLLEAVKRRDQTSVRLPCCKAKADVNAAQPDGATALAWAVSPRRTRAWRRRCSTPAPSANTADEYGETPVTLAAANGDAALARAAAGRAAATARRAVERRNAR